MIRVQIPLLEDYGYVTRRMRPDEIAQYLALTGDAEFSPDGCARVLANVAGPQYVFVDAEGAALLVGGFIPQRPGVFRAWMAGTMEGWGHYGKTYTRIARRAIRGLLDAGAHRIEIVSLASRHAAHEWYERGLGLRDEGLQAAWFADGQDARFHAVTRNKEG
jgi:hypothetical protein